MARENNGADKKTHTRLKDCSRHRNISNIMEEASPSKLGTSKNSKLTNKLEFIGQLASASERNSEPRLLAGR